MKRNILVVTLLICFYQSFSQSPELTAMNAALQKAIGPVQAASKSYEPKYALIQPAVIQYSYDEIDSKGNRTNYVYEVNVSDLDPYAVRELTQKDLITVVLAVKNKQKLVKVLKNNEVLPYDDQALIIAKDIENARQISEAIKKAIPSAEKVMANRLKLSGYDAMVNWITTNVKDVTIGTKSFKQTVTKGDKVGVVKFTLVEADAKTSVEEIYTFNLSDINPNRINYKISGNRFGVEFETLQDAKFIAVTRNGETKPFINDLVINTNNVDEARDLKNVLALAAPLAIEKVKADIPAPASEKDALAKLGALTTSITIGQKEIAQSLETSCLCQLTQVEKDAKTSTKNVFKFNWIDVNAIGSKIDVSGDRMFIEVNTNENKKLIMQTENEKFKAYENSIRIYMPSVENARRGKVAIDKAVEKCKAVYKEPFGNDAAGIFSWITKNIKDVSIDETTFKQKFEAVDAGKVNKVKYTRTEVNTKGSGAEEVYEFNLSDISPLTVEVEVRGKWLYVSMETDFKGKIIKYYKDGKIMPYTAKIDFVINDVDTSRNMVSAFQKLVKTQKAK
ncbi:MAG TPA: hypothetical protein VGD65_17300 [Chryseosolibacter sp.]